MQRSPVQLQSYQTPTSTKTQILLSHLPSAVTSFRSCWIRPPRSKRDSASLPSEGLRPQQPMEVHRPQVPEIQRALQQHMPQLLPLLLQEAVTLPQRPGATVQAAMFPTLATSRPSEIVPLTSPPMAKVPKMQLYPLSPRCQRTCRHFAPLKAHRYTHFPRPSQQTKQTFASTMKATSIEMRRPMRNLLVRACLLGTINQPYTSRVHPQLSSKRHRRNGASAVRSTSSCRARRPPRATNLPSPSAHAL